MKEISPNGADGLVVLGQFIQAIRDAGYRGTAAAVAELVDNAFEADASAVDIHLRAAHGGLVIAVKDDGVGMAPETLQLALRFGGSSRFDCRVGVGRYGMGLPNSSVSQARRVEVYTWQRPHVSWWTYLDVDAVIAGELTDVPRPRRRTFNEFGHLGHSGTVVVWSNCDRVETTDVRELTRRLASSLGRVFRHELWKGKRLSVNGESIKPFDPLFIRAGGASLVGARRIGPPLTFAVRVPRQNASSTVIVEFSELPIPAWEPLSNREKRSSGIAKGAGISVVRAGREIDIGWHFMGNKRKENYDDWWRCEVRFEPALDELFGVTHTKQGIHPTGELRELLTPDLECIARQLNANARRHFQEQRPGIGLAQRTAERRDFALEPPAQRQAARQDGGQRRRSSVGPLSGLAYRLEERLLDDLSFFVPQLASDEVLVLLNTAHPFYQRVYSKAHSGDRQREILELLLFAAARAEGTAVSKPEQKVARKLRESWSNALAAFLA